MRTKSKYFDFYDINKQTIFRQKSAKKIGTNKTNKQSKEKDLLEVLKT